MNTKRLVTVAVLIALYTVLSLFSASLGLIKLTSAQIAAGEYEQMLATLAVLRGPVDSFFDNVMVNAEDPALRATRQALLKRLYDVMNKVAEIARLAK